MAAPSGRVKLAEAMIKARSYGPAMQVLRQHLSSTPNDGQAHYLLGLAAYREGDNATAERAFRTVLSASPDNVSGLYNLGITVARAGRPDEARALFARALELDPTYEPARQRLVQLASMTGTRPSPGPPKQPDEERLRPGDLLRSGTRRVSSFAGRLLLGALLLVSGLALFLTASPGRFDWLAGRLTFPSPDHFRQLLERVRGTPLEQITQQDLDNAIRSMARTSDVLDAIGIGLAVALAALGALLFLHALLAGSRTRYDIYERRIDIASGVLNRRRTSVWLYEITDIQLRQPAWLTLTGNASVRLRLEDASKASITGFGTQDQQLSLWEELRDAALVERRALKNVWV